ncbi:hypothetical protein FACS189419_06530 [Planctomycetales bacterium]|nr:hypothetical protein FACS189419_06530 [Planctomycetales bacterium]
MEEETADSADIDFQDADDSVEISANARNVSRSAAIQIDTDIDGGKKAGFNVGKIIGSFTGIFFGLQNNIRFIGAKAGGFFRIVWQGIYGTAGKLAPYLTLRWKEGEEEITIAESPAPRSQAPRQELQGQNEQKPVQSVPKVESPAQIGQQQVKPQVKSETENADWEDLFGEKKSKYGLVVKMTAASVAALVLTTGGYFGVKTFLDKNVEPENTAMEQTTDVENPVPPMTEKPESIPEPTFAAPEQVKANPVEKIADNKPVEKMAAEKKTESPKEEPKKEIAAVDDPFMTAPVPAAAPVADSTWGDIDSVAAAPAKTPEKEIKAEDTPKPVVVPPITLAEPPAAEVKQPKKEIAGTQAKTQTENVKSGKQHSKMSRLKPLESLNTPAASQIAAANIPAVESSVYAKTASKYSGTNFGEQPVAPKTAEMIPQKSLSKSNFAEPIREITPGIPNGGGRIESVNRQATRSQQPFRQVARSSEAAPVIPKDGSQTANTRTGGAAPAVVPVLLSQKTPTLGSQLKKEVDELRQEAQPADLTLTFEPKSARANQKIAQQQTGEPALRFTPKKKDKIGKEAENVFPEALNPNGLGFDFKAQESLLPQSGENKDAKSAMEMVQNLPSIDEAPRAVIAVPGPKYRTASLDSVSATETESGMTFKKRIAAEIQRSPSSVETYVIQQGDTYLTVSDKFFGTSLLYTALAVHNRKLNIGWQPAEGAVIEVPTAEYLQENYAGVINRLERRLDRNETETAQGIKYTVKDGDTLLGLAMDKLHNSSRWHDILAMNSDRLSDPRDLRPGMEIILPLAAVGRNRLVREQ